MTNYRGSSNYRTVPSGIPGQGVDPSPSNPDYSTILDFNSSSHRLLAIDTSLDKITYSDKDTLIHASNVIGITLNAALAGQDVFYITNGIVSDVAGLVPGKVWLGNAGQLTQVVPLTGIILCVGTMLDDGTTLALNIGHSIIRS